MFEGKAMPFIVPDQKIDEVVVKFEGTRAKYPELIKEVSHKEMRVVASYLGEDTWGDPDPETWARIAKGDVYSYACYLHEKIEQSLRLTQEQRRDHHGPALYEQYTFLQSFIELKTGEKYDIIKLCFNDNRWDNNQKDIKNARIFKSYLKAKRPDIYDPEIHIEPKWNKESPRITEIMDILKKEGDLL